MFVAVALLGAYADTFVTAPPPPVVPPPTIVIRGANAADGPLFVVDGVVVVARSDINATDIEQIEVIKGAAAAALYGTETRCPRIIVHTRRPSSDPRADR